MDRGWFAVIGAGLVLVAVLGAAALGAFGMTVTTTSLGSATSVQWREPPSDGSAGVVMDLRTQTGSSFLGIKLRSDTFWAHVAMVAPPECVHEDESGRETLVTEGACADLPARGEIAGGGTTPEGNNLVIVRIGVSEQCYERLEVGVDWPPAAEACDE